MKTLQSFLLLGCLILPGCALIIHGSDQDISFMSRPAGADVWVNGWNRGLTPVIANLERSRDYEVVIELQGYKTDTIKLKKVVDGWIAGNIIFGIIPGLVIDAMTGSMYKLTPEMINTTLRPDELVIDVTLEIDPSWEKIGQLVVQ